MDQTFRTTRKQPRFRKHLLLPAEHGTWFWFLVPFFVAVGVTGIWNTAVSLTILGGFAAFLLRQPLTYWLQIQRGRGRESDKPAVIGLTIGLGLIATLSFAALLSSGHTDLLWLLPALLPLMALYLILARQKRAAIRTLWLEIGGGIGLALIAPAVTIAAEGQLSGLSFGLWGLMAAQNALGAHYVHLRLADTHKRPIRRSSVVVSHLGGFSVVLLFAIINLIPLLTAVPFLAFLLRAFWGATDPRPVENVKRFGFLEVAVEVVSGLWIVGSYLLS